MKKDGSRPRRQSLKAVWWSSVAVKWMQRSRFHAGASNGGIFDAAVYAMLTRRNGLPPDVGELHSPSKTSLGAQQFGFAPGLPMDLRTGWGFNIARTQASRSSVRAKGKAELYSWESQSVLSSASCSILMVEFGMHEEPSCRRMLPLHKANEARRIFPARTPSNSKFVAHAGGTYVVTRTRSAFHHGGPMSVWLCHLKCWQWRQSTCQKTHPAPD